MKQKKKKFSSVEKMLPLLQQLQQTYANRCESFWIHTSYDNGRLYVNVSIKTNESPFEDFSFYQFYNAEMLERKYNQLCDYLKQV
jgi:hypothetical protein